MLALKLRNNDRLHLSQEPGVISWTIFVGLSVLGLVLAIYGKDCMIWRFFSVIVSLILALFSIGEWEDVVMDRVKKMATITRCNWYGRLFSRVIAAHTRVFPLGSISGVEIRGGAVILVLRNETTVVIAKHTGFRQLEVVREEVSSFLRLSRMEQVRQEEVGEDWWLEWWDSLDGDNEPQTPSLQHSGVKVLVQRYDPVEPAAA